LIKVKERVMPKKIRCRMCGEVRVEASAGLCGFCTNLKLLVEYNPETVKKLIKEWEKEHTKKKEKNDE